MFERRRRRRSLGFVCASDLRCVCGVCAELDGCDDVMVMCSGVLGVLSVCVCVCALCGVLDETTPGCRCIVPLGLIVIGILSLRADVTVTRCGRSVR